jgi:hypothetical protein
LLVSLASLLVADAATELSNRAADDDAQLRQWRQQLAKLEASLAAARDEPPAPKPAPPAESRRRTAGANHPALRRMEQELALKERHRNAALGGGLPKEAARLDGEIAELSARLAVARELVGAGLADAETAALQKLIDERLGATARNLRANGEANAARAAAAGAELRAGRDSREAMERNAADLRAKIAEREAQLAAAPVAPAQAPAPAAVAVEEPEAQPAAAPAGDPAGEREKLRQAMAAAQQRETEASAAALRSAEAVRQAAADLKQAQDAARDLAASMNTLQALTRQREQKVKEAEGLQTSLAGAVVPIDPGADAVTVAAAGEDRRFLWMLISGAAIVVGFSLLMWVSSHGAQTLAIPDRENPFEAPVIGADLPRPPQDPNHDDERPLAV